jgi:lantibiotic modifying enzyme
MSQEWSASLTGTAADRARRTVGEIAEQLSALDDDALDGTLAGGHAGLALFFAYWSALGGGASARRAAKRRLDTAVASLAKQPMDAGLWSGLSGIAWTLHHLTTRFGFAAFDLDEIDEILRDAIAPLAARGLYDVIGGIVGLGIYFRDRGPRGHASLALVLSELRKLARVDGEGCAWRTPGNAVPAWARLDGGGDGGWYDLGMAHGNAGVIAFLAHGRLCVERRALLAAAFRWLTARRRAQPAATAFGNCAHDDAQQPSRLAWCYGDLGIAVALAAGARALDDAAAGAVAADVARRAAWRAPAQSRVTDASLCHGSAGVGHLLGRLYSRIRSPELAAASVAWLERAVEMRPHAAVSTSAGAGLLMGAAGCGLALMAAIADTPPEWDRALQAS